MVGAAKPDEADHSAGGPAPGQWSRPTVGGADHRQFRAEVAYAEAEHAFYALHKPEARIIDADANPVFSG